MKPLREIHYVMGTVLDIALFDLPEERGKVILRQGFREARRLERLLSAHDPDSALSRLNRLAGQGPVRVDLELWQLLHRSRNLQERTGGAFDVGVGALFDAWRQRQGSVSGPPPAFRVYAGGWVELDPGARLDLGSIGKGYAVDRLVAHFTAAGVDRAFINFGESSLYVLGPPPDPRGWPILIRKCDQEEFLGVLWAKDSALSTSQSHGRALQTGARYGHILDPRTGFPVDRQASSTIVTASATTAEAISTAAVLMDEPGWFDLMACFPEAEGLYMGSSRLLRCTAGLEGCFSPAHEGV